MWRPTSSAHRGRPSTRPFRESCSPTLRRQPPGAVHGRFRGTARQSQVPKNETYTRTYADSNGFLTLLADGERLTGGYALGPEAAEWLQQATLAIRAHIPIEILSDTIQPFPTFSEIYREALKSLREQIAASQQPRQMAAR